MSLFNALTVVFIVLKLMEVIAWSWWLVLLPTILYLAFIVILILIASGIFGLFVGKKKKSRYARPF